MPERCTCGAELPPDARFCHKCGKPQFDYPEPEAQPPPKEEPKTKRPAQGPILPPGVESESIEPSFRNRTAVRIAFTVAFLAMVLFIFPGPFLFPIVRLIIGFFFAGVFAAWWFSRRTGRTLSVRAGARMGWITGIFSFAMFVAVFTAAMIAISNQGGLESFYRKQIPVQDPNVDQVLKALSDPSASLMLVVTMLLLFFVVLTALPTLGGVVGAHFSAKRA